MPLLGAIRNSQKSCGRIARREAGEKGETRQVWTRVVGVRLDPQVGSDSALLTQRVPWHMSIFTPTSNANTAAKRELDAHSTSRECEFADGRPGRRRELPRKVRAQSCSPEQHYCCKFRGFWIPVALPPPVVPLPTFSARNRGSAIGHLCARLCVHLSTSRHRTSPLSGSL